MKQILILILMFPLILLAQSGVTIEPYFDADKLNTQFYDTTGQIANSVWKYNPTTGVWEIGVDLTGADASTNYKDFNEVTGVADPIAGVQRMWISPAGIVYLQTDTDTISQAAFNSINTSNLSNVIFTRPDGTTYTVSFAHSHPEYELWTGPTAFACAEITTPLPTETTASGTYYFLKGTFTNKVSEGFGLDGDTLVYTNGENQLLSGTLSFTYTTDVINSTVTQAVFVNDIAVGGEASAKIESTTGSVSITRPFCFYASPGDKIKILIKSDKSGAEITAISGTTMLQQIK